MRSLIVFIAVLSILSAKPVYAENFVIDSENSQIGFSVKHMVISTVEGKFTVFTGGFEFDEKDSEVHKAHLTIDAASVDTYHPHRDDELRGPDFFNVVKYPHIKFVLKNFKNGEGGTAAATGDLTIHGITKKIELAGDYLGSMTGPDGKLRVGFSARGTLDRRDFGLIWNKFLDTGEIVVGNEITITLEIVGISGG
ncbi:MAG: YceI family protein [Nitrospinota bacterium]